MPKTNYPDFVSSTGYGTVTGLCGANCYHEFHPFILGISEPTYTQEELDEMNRREKEPVEWNGRQYTKYEALQRQRRLETTMRAQRQEMQLLKEGGADEDDLINCRARYMGTSHEYATFSEAMGLPQQRERVTVDGLGNIMQGKTEGGSGKESPVKVPAVGANVTNKVTAEERRELLSRTPVDVHDSSIDISEKSGIIKAITIDDFNEMDSKGVISKECKETIMNTLKEQGVSYVYDEIKIVNLPRSADGKIEPLRTNAISSPSYPKVVLEVNEAVFGGRSKEQIDLMFKAQDYSVANSLEEAIVHESAHAKVIQDKTYANYEAINEELSSDRFKTPIKGREDNKSLKDLAGDISKYAQKDGLECIAETHVKLRRGESVPKELKELHDEYIQ